MEEMVQEMIRLRVASDEGMTIATIVESDIVDAAVVRQLGEELCRLADEAGSTIIILDCRKVRYISSAALNKLIVFRKRVVGAGGQLVLCRLRPAISEVFRVTRLNQMFNIERDHLAARKCV